jgi:hypothetical protein
MPAKQASATGAVKSFFVYQEPAANAKENI